MPAAVSSGICICIYLQELMGMTTVTLPITWQIPPGRQVGPYKLCLPALATEGRLSL